LEGRTTSIGKLKLALRNNPECNELLSKIKDIVIPDQNSLIDGLELFLRQSRFIETYNTLGDLYNQGKRNDAFSYFVQQATDFSKFSLKSVKYEKIFGDFEKRYINKLSTDRKRIKIPFGIDQLDEATDGGGEKGEFTMFLGDSGIGKSQFLIHCGVAAARRGFKVAHFQIEGTKEQCLDRYDSNWSGQLYHDIKHANVETALFKQLRKIVGAIGKGEIYVEAFESYGTKTVVDLRNSLIEMIKLYGTIDLVILDYFELLDPGDGVRYSPSDERHKQTKLSRAFKEIAMEFNVHFVTVTQSSILSPDDLDNPDFYITRWNSSEDKGKIRACDNFLTINQTKDERANRTARIYLDKFREHSSGKIIQIAQNLSRTRFYDRKRTMQLFINE